MKQLSKSILLWSLIIFSGSLFWPETGNTDNRLRFQGEARQATFIVKDEEQRIVMVQFERIQEEIAEIVRENELILFEQMDQLANIQGNLGRLIRNHSVLKFQTAQEIESIRSELDVMMAENILFQMEVSQQIGEGQEKIGKAILAAQRAPRETKTFRTAQEQLGKVIRNNGILHREIASKIGVNQNRLGMAIRDHASFLVRTSEQIGRGEEQLARMILHQAQTLQAAKQVVILGHERLGAAIREEAGVERKLLAQFESLR